MILSRFVALSVSLIQYASLLQGELGVAKSGDQECSIPCPGDETEQCGGQWRNSVYEARGSGLTLAAGLLARYSFDDSANPAGDDSGNGHNGVTEGGVTFVPGGGDHGTVASFDGTGRIVVDSFINWAWGNAFSVSVWFNRGCLNEACFGGPRCDGNYMGIVSNGYCEYSIGLPPRSRLTQTVAANRPPWLVRSSHGRRG